jgi:hypothetical protein
LKHNACTTQPRGACTRTFTTATTEPFHPCSHALLQPGVSLFDDCPSLGAGDASALAAAAQAAARGGGPHLPPEAAAAAAAWCRAVTLHHPSVVLCREHAAALVALRQAVVEVCPGFGVKGFKDFGRSNCLAGSSLPFLAIPCS